MLNLKIIAINDGTKTLKIPEWNEHYHSTHGAISEAQHVNIKMVLTLLNLKKYQSLKWGLAQV